MPTIFALKNCTHFRELLVDMGKKHLATDEEIEHYFNLCACKIQIEKTKISGTISL